MRVGARTKIVTLVLTLLCAALLLWVFATRLRVDRGSVSGEYYAEYASANEQLVLNVDGTFSQMISFDDGRDALNNSGTWEYENIGKHGDSYVSFNGLIKIEALDGSISISKNGISAMPIYRWPFKVVICCHVNEDVLYYKR